MMATFISSVQFTEQGIANIQETVKRTNAVKRSAKAMGVKVKDVYWTLGLADGVIIFTADDDESATAFMLNIGSKMNVQTSTSRAFNAKEMGEILKKMPG